MLDIFTDLLPHTSIAELDEGYCAYDEKDNDRDGRSKSVIDTPTGSKSQVIHVADQDVSMSGWGGRTGHGWAAGIEYVDQIEIVKIEDE